MKSLKRTPQIVKRTPSQLSIFNTLSWEIKVQILIPFLVVSFFLQQGIVDSGINHLSCLRIEPKQVNCKHEISQLLGLVQQSSISFNQVTVAKLNIREDVTADGDITIEHRVLLTTDIGEIIYIQEPAIKVEDQRGRAQKMQIIVNQINSFLASDQSTLTLQQDTRLFGILMTSLLVVVGGITSYYIFRSEVLVFNKATSQCCCTRKTLLGNRVWKFPTCAITFQGEEPT